MSQGLPMGSGLVGLALAQDLIESVRGRGAAIKLRGANAAPFAAQEAGVATLTAGLKAQFDPRHILNQGLM
jgi:glycolate oxidase FAD binding subunit